MMNEISILYVEDEIDILEGIQSYLSLKFKTVYTAMNGEEGLKLYKEKQPDIVLTDITMPIMDGLSMAEHIRAINNDVPIILMTALSDTNSFITAIDMGIDGYIIKPASKEALEKNLEKSAKTINNKRLLIRKQKLLSEYRNAVDEGALVSKTDINGIITYSNEEFCKVSGYTKDELIGKPHSIVRHPDTSKSIFQEMWKTILSKKVWRGSYWNRAKDGTSYYINAVITPILDENSEIVEFLALRQDITKLFELSHEVDKLNAYVMEQENLAKDKLEAGIVNQMNDDECEILYMPSDILSGDFYSIYKRDDGSIFVYLIDGQGHGVSPALTVFATSSMMNYIIHQIDSLEELIEGLQKIARTFLGEIEQLSYTMIMISPDKKTLTYSSGGMYPFLIKTGSEILEIKANNLPFMNFSPSPISTEIKLDNWESLLVYSDGIVEHESEELGKNMAKTIINNPSNIKDDMKKIQKHDFEDDVTMVYLKNI